MTMQYSAKKLCTLLLAGGFLISGNLISAEFSYDNKALSGEKPWTSEAFQNDPDGFQFVVFKSLMSNFVSLSAILSHLFLKKRIFAPC